MKVDVIHTSCLDKCIKKEVVHTACWKKLILCLTLLFARWTHSDKLITIASYKIMCMHYHSLALPEAWLSYKCLYIESIKALKKSVNYTHTRLAGVIVCCT